MSNTKIALPTEHCETCPAFTQLEQMGIKVGDFDRVVALAPGRYLLSTKIDLDAIAPEPAEDDGNGRDELPRRRRPGMRGRRRGTARGT